MSKIIVPGKDFQTNEFQRDDYSKAKFEHKPHGAIMLDGVEVAHTLQCPHCGQHFVSYPGSGALRGFCFKCMAVI